MRSGLVPCQCWEVSGWSIVVNGRSARLSLIEPATGSRLAVPRAGSVELGGALSSMLDMPLTQALPRHYHGSTLALHLQPPVIII